MNVAKRAWVYQGLALTEGVGIVTPLSSRKKRSRVTGQLVLFGDEMAMGLSAPMMQLAMESADLVWVGRKGASPVDWQRNGWVQLLREVVSAPALFLGAFRWAPGAPPHAMSAIEGDLASLGHSTVWLVPPRAICGPSDVATSSLAMLDSAGMMIQIGPDGQQPTTLGYASWAGAVWGWLRTQSLLTG